MSITLKEVEDYKGSSKFSNPDDKEWSDNKYYVLLSEFDDGLLIYADYESEALDIAIDWHEEKGNIGLFQEEYDEEKGSGGNHCLNLSSHNVRIQEVRG